MKQFIIPARLIALAAFEAARIHGEDPADLFEDEKSSRGRLIAIEAIRYVFPLASQISIARHFGYEGSGAMLSGRLANARAARWWRPEDVKSVFLQIAPHRDVQDGEPVVKASEDLAARLPLTPRHALSTISGRSITSALMGDPPPGRREYLAQLASEGCSGGNPNADIIRKGRNIGRRVPA